MESTNKATEVPLLKVSGLEKSFGPVNVLKGIDFVLRRGRALGLVGENGAGKSTLVRCVCGRLLADKGSIDFCGKVYLVPQEFTLVNELTVAENLFLGREPRTMGFVHSRSMITQAVAALERIGAGAIDPQTKVSELGVADRQKVEISKALVERADLIVLDEPTTVLSSDETAVLFRVLRSLMSSGVSILYISHKLDEVRELCHDIAVLRDGALVKCAPSEYFTSQDLASLMVGRSLGDIYPPKIPVPTPDREVVLDVDNITDSSKVLGASLKLHKGEILGLAGLAGAGRTELAELICGMRKRTGGSMRLFGKVYNPSSMRDALASGIAYLSEDRQGTALLTQWSIENNVTISSLRAYACGGVFTSRTKIRKSATKYIRDLSLRCTDSEQSVQELSGGNQQKVAIAKGLDTKPALYIFDEPTRGVDVGARAEIYSIIHDLASTGTAVLLISSDLTEIIGNCSRTIVMRDGRIAGCVDNPTESAVVALYY